MKETLEVDLHQSEETILVADRRHQGSSSGSRPPPGGPSSGSKPPSVSGPCPKTPDVGFPFDNSSCTNNGYKIVCKAGCRNRRYQFVECKLSGYNANKWRYRKRC